MAWSPVELIRRARGLLVDLDGPLFGGLDPRPAALELVQILLRKGKDLRYLSNDSHHHPRDLARTLRAGGLQVTHPEILTAASMSGRVIRRNLGCLTLLTLASEYVAGQLAEAGHYVVWPGSRTPKVDALLLGRAEGITWSDLEAGLNALDRGSRLILINPDLSVPVSLGHRVLQPGALAASLMATANVVPFVIGKPQPHIFREAARDLGYLPGEIVFLSEGPAEALGGAQDYGIAAVRVESLKGQGLESSLASSYIEDLLKDLG